MALRLGRIRRSDGVSLLAITLTVLLDASDAATPAQSPHKHRPLACASRSSERGREGLEALLTARPLASRYVISQRPENRSPMPIQCLLTLALAAGASLRRGRWEMPADFDAEQFWQPGAYRRQLRRPASSNEQGPGLLAASTHGGRARKGRAERITRALPTTHQSMPPSWFTHDASDWIVGNSGGWAGPGVSAIGSDDLERARFSTAHAPYFNALANHVLRFDERCTDGGPTARRECNRAARFWGRETAHAEPTATVLDRAGQVMGAMSPPFPHSPSAPTSPGRRAKAVFAGARRAQKLSACSLKQCPSSRRSTVWPLRTSRPARVESRPLTSA